MFEPSRDPGAYEEIVKEAMAEQRPTFYAMQSGALPPSLPVDKKDAALFYTPGALQGACIVSLRVRLPESEARALFQELQSSQHEQVSASEVNLIPPIIPLFPNEWKRSGRNKEDYMLPEDFTAFLFLSNLKNLGEHYRVAFVAVSLQRSEVIYYFINA